MTTRTSGRREIPIPGAVSLDSRESAEHDRKRLKSSDAHDARLVGRVACVDGERHVFLRSQEGLECDPCFHAGERRTEAEMLPESEAEMILDVRAVEHEAIRLGKLRFVPIGRAPE